MISPVSFGMTVNRTQSIVQSPKVVQAQFLLQKSNQTLHKPDLFFKGKDARQEQLDLASQKIAELAIKQKESEQSLTDFRKKLKDESLKAEHQNFRDKIAKLNVELADINLRISLWKRLKQVLTGVRDINEVDSRFSRNTLLHDVADSGDHVLTAAVLKLHPSVDPKDRFKRTPLLLAIQSNEETEEVFTLVQLLLMHGADPTKRGRTSEREGLNALEEAERRGFHRIAAELSKHLPEGYVRPDHLASLQHELEPEHQVKLNLFRMPHETSVDKSGKTKIQLREGPHKKREKKDPFGDNEPAGPINFTKVKIPAPFQKPYWDLADKFFQSLSPSEK